MGRAGREAELGGGGRGEAWRGRGPFPRGGLAHLLDLQPPGAELGVLGAASPPAQHGVAEPLAEGLVVEAERGAGLAERVCGGPRAGRPLWAALVALSLGRGGGVVGGCHGGREFGVPEEEERRRRRAGGGMAAAGGIGARGRRRRRRAAAQFRLCSAAGQEEALEAGGVRQEEEGAEAEREQAREEEQHHELVRQPQTQRRRRTARHARQLPQQQHGSAARPAGLRGEPAAAAASAPGEGMQTTWARRSLHQPHRIEGSGREARGLEETADGQKN